MKKNILILLGAIFAILAVSAFVWFNRGFFDSNQKNAPARESEKAIPGKFTGSFEDLILLGDDLICQKDGVAGSDLRRQVVYCSGGNMRIDTFIERNGVKMDTFIIIQNNWAYIWDNGKIAYKQPYLEGSLPEFVPPAVDLSCERWEPDHSVFNLPLAAFENLPEVEAKK